MNPLLLKDISNEVKDEGNQPISHVNKLVRLQRNFLWGGSSEQNKIAWIRWDMVCLPKEEGGLGVKDITSFNISLLEK